MNEFEKLLAQAKTILEAGLKLQSISKLGSSAEDLTEYMAGQEKFIQDVSKFVTDMPEAYKGVFKEIDEEMKTLRKEIALFKQPKKELTRKDVYKAITQAAMYAMYGFDAFKTEEGRASLKDVIFPGSFVEEKTIRSNMIDKAALDDTPLNPGGTNAGYTINPIYERELLKYTAEISDMMGFTRRLPMLAPQVSFPYLSARTFAFTRTAATSSGTTWSSTTPLAAATDGPTFGARVTLQATTLAAYIPWIDEFKDDLQVNESLEALMSECFMEAFAEDFDKNVLTNNVDTVGVEYDGLLHTDDIKTYTVDSSTVNGVFPDELMTALLKIARMDRDGGSWILNESVLVELMKMQNGMGDYMFWTPPTGEKPGMLAGKPYIEAHVMPSNEELAPGDTFMAYANSNNLWVGERQGLEVRQFDATHYNLEYGENFTRWRIRNGFKVVRPLASLLVKLKN